jgi:adenylate cyclase
MRAHRGRPREELGSLMMLMRLRAWLFTGASSSVDVRLPARVQKELVREQFRAELLVTGVQLFLVALLAALYASTPAGYSPDAPIEAAPLGLVFFALLALVRLYTASTGQLTRPVLAAGVVAEMLVLLFVIWATHLQYEQPLQFSLKSTQFVYVFILVALRALRFEPVWVLVSGLTAAAGWTVLVTLAVQRAPDNPITWDYVTSLRSIQIHLGGEFDKVLAVLVVTGVLGLAIARARHLLERTVAQQRAVADLSLFFDDSVARRITASEADVMAGQGEQRDAAILFLDMRGFTEASMRLTPTELIALLGEYQRLAVPIIKRHGGSIDKFMGDGILASFGAIAPDAHYAAHALRAVDAILVAVDEWRSDRMQKGAIAPDVGGGLATGSVVFGIIGDRTRLEYTVIGDAVNLAAKLEKHNKIEKTRAVTTRVAYEQALSQGYVGGKVLRDARAVAGVAAPLDLAVLADRR